MTHRSLERLRNLDDLLRNGNDGFGAIGLFLHRTIERWIYDATPRNSLTFASTGGDGVHFGFLRVGEDAEAWPVVMTVPMCFDNSNVIAGEDLVEFLALGMHTSFYGLEQLAYSPAETAAALDAETPSPGAQLLLDAIAVEFSLHRWPDVAGRLAMLRTRFAGFLDVRDDPPRERTPIDPVAFWEAHIANELAKPLGERNDGTIRDMRARLAHVRDAIRKQ